MQLEKCRVFFLFFSDKWDLNSIILKKEKKDAKQSNV